MICYKDRAWCTSSFACSNTECPRNLNEKEVEQAVKWWGGLDFPYSMNDFKTDDCGYIEVLECKN